MPKKCYSQLLIKTLTLPLDSATPISRVIPHLFYLSDFVYPLFFVNLPTKSFFFGCHPLEGVTRGGPLPLVTPLPISPKRAISRRSHDVFTLWPWPLTLDLEVYSKVHRVSRSRNLYEIWPKAKNPRLSYWRFRHFFCSFFLPGRCCGHEISELGANHTRFQGGYQTSDALLSFETIGP